MYTQMCVRRMFSRAITRRLAYLHRKKHIFIYIQIYIYMYVCMHVYIWTHMCVCV